jgi:hypothetical protein
MAGQHKGSRQREVDSRINREAWKEPKVGMRRDDYLRGKINDAKPVKKITVKENPIVAGSYKHGVRKLRVGKRAA